MPWASCLPAFATLRDNRLPAVCNGWRLTRKPWQAQHDKPIGSPKVALPAHCGVFRAEGIHFQADDSGDCIEVRWGDGDGHYAATGDDRVKALLDSSGNILGFKITGISQMGEGEKDFISVDLYPATRPSPRK